MAQAAGQVFRQLNDADMTFGAMRNERGERDRTEPCQLQRAFALAPAQRPQGGVPSILSAVRRPSAHVGGGAQRFGAARHVLRPGPQPSGALEAALFPDRVPVAVYDNLIASVHRHLPAVQHYYDVRRRKMRLKDIHHYDTYVPILADLQTRHTWNQAVAAVLAALEPLGSDYCNTLGTRA